MRRRSLLFLVIGAMVGATGVVTLGTVAPESASAAGTHRVLITGDSITHGSNGDYTWRYRLDKKLQQTAPGQYAIVGPTTTLFDHVDNTTSSNYLDANFTGKAHAAKWGTTFIDQLPNIRSQVINSNVDTLVVMLGSNDLTFHTTPAATVANLKSYIEAARSGRPGIDVVVGEVVTRWNPWTKSITLADQAAGYKARIAALANQMNTASERVVIAPTLTGWDPVAHTWDGTHPNSAGETLIAQRVSEGLAQVGLGTVLPNVYKANARWSMKAPAPTVSVGTEQATLSWSLKSTGSTGMYISYHLDKPGQDWVHLPYPVGSNYDNSWTVKPLAGGASYDFALIASKGFMPSDVFGQQVRRAIPGITPAKPTNIVTKVVASDPTWGNQIEMSWAASQNAHAYILSQRAAPESSFTELPYPLVGTSFAFGALQPGRHYKFRATAARGFLRSNPGKSKLTRSKGIPAYANYVVLGDSYAAGNGLYVAENNGNHIPPDTPWYEDSTCYRASASWSSRVLLFHAPRRKIVACSGSQLPQIPGQVGAAKSFIAQQPDRALLLTVSIGGNDVGFTDVLVDCIIGSCAAGNKPQELEWWIDDLQSTLATMYKDLREEFKYADIVAMGYPAPISPSSTSWQCSGVNETEKLMVVLATRRLNNVIDSAASASNVWGGVGADLADAFAGRSACSDNALIHNYQLPLPIAFHQNEQGHAKYGEVMNGYLKRKMS